MRTMRGGKLDTAHIKISGQVGQSSGCYFSVATFLPVDLDQSNLLELIQAASCGFERPSINIIRQVLHHVIVDDSRGCGHPRISEKFENKIIFPGHPISSTTHSIGYDARVAISMSRYKQIVNLSVHIMSTYMDNTYYSSVKTTGVTQRDISVANCENGGTTLSSAGCPFESPGLSNNENNEPTSHKLSASIS